MKISPPDVQTVPLWVILTCAVAVAAVLVAVVIIGAWLRRRKSPIGRKKLPVAALAAVGAVAILTGSAAGVGVAAVNSEAEQQHLAAVSSAVYGTYGVSLTDQQAKDLEWPTGSWTSLEDWPSTGQRYGTTEVVEQETARSVQLVWDGNEFVLRVLSERSVMPGQPLVG